MEGREAPEQGPEYTVVGVINDGAELNQAVTEIRELGVDRDDLTVVLKREDTSEPEPFPDGTRYIVVPADKRGLEVPIGFAIAFIVFGVLFAITTPAIGIPTLMVFVSLAAILFAGSLTRVGVTPILIEMGAPRRRPDAWNDDVRVRQGTRLRLDGRARGCSGPIREALQRVGGMYYIVDRRSGAPRRPPGHPAPRRRATGAGESVLRTVPVAA